MGVLGAIIRPQPLLMRAGQAKMPERCPVGAELVGGQQFRREAQFPQELTHQPKGRALVASALHQHIEDLQRRTVSYDTSSPRSATSSSTSRWLRANRRYSQIACWMNPGGKRCRRY